MRSPLWPVRSPLWLVLLHGAAAHRQYVEQIPNGDVFMPVWKAVGHVAPLPQAISRAKGMAIANVRFPRNPFGVAFRAAGFRWTEALCRQDSDGDGLTNGEELGDPHCVWRPGSRSTVDGRMNSTGLSHPGVPGEDGRWANLIGHAAKLECQLGVGCQRLGAGPGITHGKMDVRRSAPAWEVAYYHYRVVPLMLALGVAVYLRAPFAPPPRWWLVCLLVYLVCHVGVFIGCHRWASHHQFVASTPLKWFLSLLAAWCLQGTPAHWAFLHRLHHRFCDQGLLDLQAPRAPHFVLYGHYSWFTTPVEHFFMSSHTNGEAIIPDLLHDPAMPSFGREVRAHALCHVSILAAIALGYAACELIRRRAEDTPGRIVYETVLKAYVIACWYFWLPCALAFQCVLLVIDAVHMWGDRAFEDAMSAPCDARNNAFLFFPLLGENWHNNHHATPRSASTWVWSYQLDCQYMTIRLFELLGLASDVVIEHPSKLVANYSFDGLHVSVAGELALSALVVLTLRWAPTLRFGAAEARRSKLFEPSCDVDDRGEPEVASSLLNIALPSSTGSSPLKISG